MIRKEIVVRDAVHGDILFTPLEVRVIDTREFQRLRGIKQLGTEYLVFPSALHTRFEHSLGSCHIAQRMIDSINARAGTERISKVQTRLIRLTALLHDITHVPFGHTVEDERRIYPRHDRGPRLRFFLEESSIGKVLDDEESGLKEEILRILSAKEEAEIAALNAPFAEDIVGNNLCADLLDYLRRDVYFTGLCQHYDERVFRYLEIDDDNRLVVRLEKAGALRRDVLSEVINILRIRYTLTERAYYHHAKVATSAMVSKAVESAQLKEEELYDLRDDELLFKLENHESEVARRITGKLRSRQMYKPVYRIRHEIAFAEDRKRQLVKDFHYNTRKRQDLETELSKACQLSDGSVIIYCPEEKMALKEASAKVVWRNGITIPLNEIEHDPPYGEIRELNTKYVTLWKMYVFLDSAYHAEKAKKLAGLCFDEFRLMNDIEELSKF